MARGLLDDGDGNVVIVDVNGVGGVDFMARSIPRLHARTAGSVGAGVMVTLRAGLAGCW